jgi:hypothetical protein
MGPEPLNQFHADLLHIVRPRRFLLLNDCEGCNTNPLKFRLRAPYYGRSKGDFCDGHLSVLRRRYDPLR